MRHAPASARRRVGEMEDMVEVENLLHVGFTPESHGQYGKVRMLDADVKEAMAEYDRVHGTQS